MNIMHALNMYNGDLSTLRGEPRSKYFTSPFPQVLRIPDAKSEDCPNYMSRHIQIAVSLRNMIDNIVAN